MMPRTLLLSEIFPPKHGGSGRWFWEIARRLPRESYSILAGDDPAAAAFDATHDLRLERAPLTLSQWGLASLSGVRGYARILRTVLRTMQRDRITELHVGRCLPEGWIGVMLNLLRGTPFTCFVHGEDVETAACSRELSWMVRRVLGRAKRLIANSHNTARILRETWNVPESKIVVLHPGCDTSRFVPGPRDSAVRQRLGWNDRPVVLTVGRLQKRKGHDTLIRALPTIREAVPEVLYSIIGHGEERSALEQLAQAEGVAPHVQFLGEVDDATMIAAMQQCDVFTLPNRAVGRDIEGFGMVLVEAQSCGRPVIAGASGGTSETMDVGETGLIVPCETPGSLAEALIPLLLNPLRCDQMGRAGREWAVRHFDWTSLAAQAARVFAGEHPQIERRPSARSPDPTGLVPVVK